MSDPEPPRGSRVPDRAVKPKDPDPGPLRTLFLDWR
jgi:hypothetical protein